MSNRYAISRIVKSGHFKQSIFYGVFLAIVLVASVLVNELALKFSELVASIIVPTLPIVQFDMNMIFMVIICVFTVGSFLLTLRVLIPKLHNFIFGSAGTKHAKITYSLPLTFAITALFLLGLAFDANKKILSDFVEQYGPWLALSGLILTLCGLYISAIAMQDLRHVINTFEDFKVRFSSMLKDVGEDNDDSNYVRIMAFTPLPGALALKSKDYLALRELILATNTRVEIVCLDKQSSKEWMGRFLGKKVRGGDRLDQGAINRAVEQVEELITDIQNPVLTAKRKFVSEHPVTRGTTAELPRFYAYITNDRALVINPLYFPIEGKNADEQPVDLKDRPVELVGFETTDTYTLQNLLNTYDLVLQQLKNRELQHAI